MGIFSQHRGTESRQATSTLIAKGCAVSGELKLENDIQVDGIVNGQVNVDSTLIVSESGRVKGDVYANKLIINGIVEGNCYAEQVQVLEKGRVTGKVWSNNLSIEPGGKFFGEAAELPEKEVISLKSKTQEHQNQQKNQSSDNKSISRKQA
ncbi:bactofilin family protein [Vibrio rotiferianus]|uniref:bactofilin family protein n=1 Tax=Vibrio rotiferianus TaxID=190895 RepID=UPI00148D698C|nr:polymer-forming cytoskeletal protein [Vibrio rotiferianus]NOH66822.1 polymer-forming cytoskeletal protein [Vibrio rotiferianus]